MHFTLHWLVKMSMVMGNLVIRISAGQKWCTSGLCCVVSGRHYFSTIKPHYTWWLVIPNSHLHSHCFLNSMQNLLVHRLKPRYKLTNHLRPFLCSSPEIASSYWVMQSMTLVRTLGCHFSWTGKPLLPLLVFLSGP